MECVVAQESGVGALDQWLAVKSISGIDWLRNFRLPPTSPEISKNVSFSGIWDIYSSISSLKGSQNYFDH
jgi:hypothetical protein